MAANTLSVFTKPWRELPLRQLGTLVCRLGFQAIELPIRPGYQVPPERAGTLLPDAVRILAESGISVASVASTPEHGIVDACACAGVSLIRDMARVLPGERYTDAEIRLRAEYARLGPALASAGVRLGIQNHAGSFVPNALGLRALLSDLDPAVFVAVWDAAHEALAGMAPQYALDVIAPRLGMVNLKNGYWRRKGDCGATGQAWEVAWTGGQAGLARWDEVVRLLQSSGYSGVICLTAEYSDASAVDRLIAEDAAYARHLLAGA